MDLNIGEIIPLPLSVMCNMSNVTFHVLCLLPGVIVFSSSLFGQSGEVSWWRVGYERGYPI